MYVKVYISLHTSNQLINYKLFPHSMPWAIECTHSTVSPIESIHSTAEPLNVYIQQFAHWIYTFNGLTRWMYTFNSYLHSIQHIYRCTETINNSKPSKQTFMKRFAYIGSGQRKKLLNFAKDSDYIQDTKKFQISKGSLFKCTFKDLGVLLDITLKAVSGS